jgi:hypothetical protein
MLDLPDGMLASFLLPSAASSATDFPARAATTYQSFSSYAIPLKMNFSIFFFTKEEDF